jgi:ubiquinone/menaquinone biosynthesis C-methylase UbiE
MRDDEIGRMAQSESVHWWYRALHGLVIGLVGEVLRASVPARSAVTHSVSILDAGAGTGGMLRALVSSELLAGRAVELSGSDISESACAALERLGLPARIVTADIAALPFPDATFDIAICLNVLEQESVDPRHALRELNRCLKPGGALILNASAYRWMYSYHDVAVSQSRRFTRRELERLAAEEGFTVRRRTYWNTVLFPVMLVRRRLVVRRDGASDVEIPGRLQQTIGTAATAFERWWILRGGSFPFGGAILISATKEGLP